MKRHRNSSHASTLSFNEKLLPKWAKLIPPLSRNDSGSIGKYHARTLSCGNQSAHLFDSDEIFEKQNEDEYLRTLTYHTIAQYLENSLQKLIETSCSPMVCELLEHISTASSPPADNNDIANDVNIEPIVTDGNINSPREDTEASPQASRAGFTEKDPFVCKYTVRKSIVYDPLLLPLFVLEKAPFSMTDKLLISSYVLRQIQKAEPRTCCISLPSNHQHPLNYGSHKCNLSFKEDFMNQCWNQEVNQFLGHTNDLSRRKGILRQLKKIKSTLSITDQLVLWASQTVYFDSIVIFWNVEHGSFIYNHHSNVLNSGKQSLEQFIQWCAERRVMHGVPISIILYDPKNGYRQSVPFYSSIQSMIGIRVHNIASIPSTCTMFNQFWKNIVSDVVHENHPTANLVYSVCHAYAAEVSNIIGTFKNQDQSITRSIRAIQVLISKYLSAPSNMKSFPSTVAVLCQAVRSTNLLKRITSLLYDNGFLKYLLKNQSKSVSSEMKMSSSLLFHGVEEYEMRCVLVSIMLQIYGTVWDKHLQGIDHHHKDSISVGPYSSLPFLLFDRQRSSLQSGCEFDRILLKDEDRQFIVGLLFKYRTSTPCNQGPISAYIDVPVERNNLLRGVLVEQILRVINEMIVLVDHCISLKDVFGCLESSLMAIIHIDGKVCHPSTLPRRDYAHALLHDVKIAHGSKIAMGVRIPGWLYEIVQNRISISEVEWYQAFYQRYLDEIDDSPTAAKLFPLFACGIRHLQVSGFIRRSIGRNSIVQYERTALVWCGGE